MAKANEPNCNEYRILSYDATWRNDLGNEGEFVLEGKDTRIRAFCSGAPGSCGGFADAVGRNVELDHSITGLLLHHEPLCQDPLYVKNAIEQVAEITGKRPTEAQVCSQTLVIERIDAK